MLVKEGRLNIILSIPADFLEKFIHFINNINALNSDKGQPVIVEKIYYDKEDSIEDKAESE